MATSNKAKNTARYDAKTTMYACVGAGQLLIDKVKELPGKANLATWPKGAAKTYRDLADRGEKLIASIGGSAYTRRALDQAKAARSQAKATATSVRKAAGSTAEATRSAAKKAS
jgi:hypothetical protein